MSKLVILTKSPRLSTVDFLVLYKNLIKKALGQRRGPSVVTNSLIQGLIQLEYRYTLNPRSKNISGDDTIYVNGSISALKWAIRAKKDKKINKLIVGPALVVLPHEMNHILSSPEIDVIIVPSQWVKDVWIQQAPELEDKIRIWAAGVSIPSKKFVKDSTLLVYKKNVDNALYNGVIDFLDTENINYIVIKYGFYNHDQYLHLLQKAKAMIYLTESESQGLALCEAWAHDVPTFVWNRGYWEYNDYRWDDEKISAPYLTHQNGMFFENIDVFMDKWYDFWTKLDKFSPKNNVELNFSNNIVAKKFLELTEEV